VTYVFGSSGNLGRSSKFNVLERSKSWKPLGIRENANDVVRIIGVQSKTSTERRMSHVGFFVAIDTPIESRQSERIVPKQE